MAIVDIIGRLATIGERSFVIEVVIVLKRVGQQLGLHEQYLMRWALLGRREGKLHHNHLIPHSYG